MTALRTASPVRSRRATRTAGASPQRVGDVTLHEADTAQTYREKLARIVLDQMYQFVGLLDAQGMTLEINRAALEGAGVRLDDIRGKPFWEARWFAVSAQSVQATQDFVCRSRQGEFIRCDIEVYGKAAGEETIIVDFSLLPVRDQSGAVVFLLAEGRNITEKKRAEAEIARKNAELQTLLERIRQLDQLKNDLFANVSHELRTPLALILGTTDDMLARADPLTAEQARGLAVTRRNAVALLRHVNDLLDLAKLDARKMTLSYARVDLAHLVRVVAEQFRPIAAQRRASYSIEAPQALHAEVDLEKIERVILNLLSNAFKFTPPGGHIRCVLERVGKSGARFHVQDSGPGVAPEMRTSIFERFRQAQQGTTRDVGGTGLGLAITKEFVELHAGIIDVGAAPGGGAIFSIDLPLKAPSTVRVGSAPGALPLPARSVASEGVVVELLATQADAPEEAWSEGRPTALVVEDNAEMRRFVRDALAAEFRVIAVADGQLALERARAEPPDIVVTDLMLPRLGGDRLVDEMRACTALADVPVIVLSAKDDEALRNRLLAESVQDYVTKPFSAHELRARVRNLTVMKRARDVLRREVASHSKDLAELTDTLVASRHALQESEHRWWAIYEHSPVGIALIDLAGQIRAANPAFRAMLGDSANQVDTCSLQQITPPEERAATALHLERLIRGEVRDYHVQRRFLRLDGRMVWANTSVSLIPGATDATRLLVVVAEDISDQKAAQDALARAQNELARVMRASTLGELAASIAHEVNQPLAAIAANGHACVRWLDAEPPDEPEARAAARRIVRDANRASEVIKHIREFLKRGEVVREPIRIDAVIADVLALIRAEAQALAIDLQHPIGGELPCVLADRVQVQQVILNLVMNALEAMRRASGGCRTIEISACRSATEGVQVDVCDCGCGIDASQIERVFDAFHTTKPQGMGMGLAISRSIVEAHGGRLWVTPNPGPGVTFSFSLPVDAPTAASV